MKIFCVGRNYSEHAKELGNAIPQSPVIFMKPDTALLKGNDFYLPEFSKNIHYEVEVVIKISKPGKYILEQNAAKHYEEFSLGIDFTARDLQNELKSKGLPWELAKGFDGSAVVGPFLNKNSYKLEELHFSLFKNRNKVQEGNTQEMMFSFDNIIAFISKYFTLRAGDLIFTGTPKGVGETVENDRLEGYIGDKKLLDLRVV